MFRRKHTMKVKAKAVWNKDKELWEVVIKQEETAFVYPRGKWVKKFRNHTAKYEIDDCCDEYVIPWAILQDNGINTNAIDEALERSDVN